MGLKSGFALVKGSEISISEQIPFKPPVKFSRVTVRAGYGPRSSNQRVSDITAWAGLFFKKTTQPALMCLGAYDSRGRIHSALDYIYA
jgi:hypothetical protein